MPLFEFAIKASLARYDLDTPEGRTSATPAAMEVVRKIRDVSLRTAYARQLSGWLGLPDPDELVVHARGGTNQIGRYARTVAPDDPALRFERDALKVVLVDDMSAAIGSANLDNRSFRLNFEIMVLTVDRRFASEVEKMLLDDFAQSWEISRDDYLGAPAWRRMAMHVARLFSPIL